MESTSYISIIALTLSLACSALVAMGQACVGSTQREQADLFRVQGDLEKPKSPWDQLSALRLIASVFFSASMVSTVSVVVAWAGINWTLIALSSLVTLVFLGILHGTARVLASRLSDTTTLRIVSVVDAPTWALRPVLAAQAILMRWALTLPGYEAQGQPPEELTPSLQARGGRLDEHEVRMIRGVVRLDVTVAREIMVPRVDMVVVKTDTPISTVARRMIESGHSRIPVYKDDLDHIEGIAYALDALDQLIKAEDVSTLAVDKIVRPVLFIPESKTLEDLLNDFQQRRMHMAIVADEYGGVSGLVTIEDLLEEIVGEIRDEFEVGEPEIEAVNENEFLIDAGVSIDQLNQLLSVSLEGEGFDTLGGFIYHRLGKIPSPGDAVVYDALNIEVVSTVGRRLNRLRVTKLKKEDSTAPPE